jgi:hypothetical protein
MTRNILVLRSSISSALLKETLLRGFIVAFFGVLILLFAGSYLPVEFLHKWGWSLFLIGIGLVTLGMLPYRHLSRLQIKPNELILSDSDHIVFFQKGKKLLTIPLQSIAQMKCVIHPRLYGIALWLKSTPLEPIVVHQSAKEVENMRRLGQRIGNADLFFPYFNQRAYDELMDWQYEEREEE